LSEIESTWDFKFWSDNIRHCTFISPVTRDEVDLYIEYLHASNDELSDLNEDWQDYTEYKLNDTNSEDGSSLPEWYEFHNVRSGNGALLNLPDIRGDKEEFYRKIWADHNLKNAPNPEWKPLLIQTTENQEALMETVESSEFRKMYKRFNKMKEIIDSQEEVEEAFYFLHDLYHEVPIEAHPTSIRRSQRSFHKSLKNIS
jgi:hypothetical protein